MRMTKGIRLTMLRRITFILLPLLINFQHADAKPKSPHYTFFLPDAYVGWVQIIFNDPQAPQLEWKDGGYQIEVPVSGIARTADVLVLDSSPKRKDEFYYRFQAANGNAELRSVPSAYTMPGVLHGGFDVMDTGGNGKGSSWFLFIGPPEVRAKVPLADWDKVVATHKTPDGRATRIPAPDPYPTPGRILSPIPKE